MSKINLTDVQAGYRVTSVINDNNQKIEDAIENTLSRDGSSPNGMNAPIDMNAHKIINVAPGTVASDAATKGQLDSFVQNIPSTLLDQLAVKVAALIGGDVEPPQGYTNPPAPTTVTTSNVTSSSVDITITMSSTTWAEGYNVWRNGSLLDRIRSGSALSYTDVTVAPNTPYTYAVSSFNDTYDYESLRTTATPITTPTTTSTAQPGAVTNLNGNILADRTILLTWSYNSLVPFNYFRFRRFGTDIGQVTYGQVHNFIDTNPVVGVNTYTVDAYSIGYGGAGTAATFSITLPPLNNTTPVDPPTSVVATASSSTQIDTTWAYTGNTHDGFLVEISGPNDFYDSRTVNKAGRGVSIGGLTPSTLYSITVSAITWNGATVGTYPASPVTATTSSGTVVKPPKIDPAYDVTISGKIGVAFSQIPSITAIDGSGSYQFEISRTPAGTSLNLNGSWTGTPTTSGITNATLVITDLTTGLIGSASILFQIASADLTASYPSGTSEGSTLSIADGESWSGKTWTFTGGTAPLSITWNGALPAGFTQGTTSTTATLTGSSSQAFSGTYPVQITVTSNDSQTVVVNHTIQYTYTAAANSPPVIAPLSTGNFTEGVTYASMTDVGAATTDPDLNSGLPDPPTGITYGIAGIVDKNGATVTAGSLGLSISSSTGVISGTYASGKAADAPYTITTYADDGEDEPFTVSHNIPTLYTTSSSVPSSVGIAGAGGSGSYSYATSPVSGTMPTWLGNAINSSTGLITGATGSITAGTTTFTLRATDTGTSETRDVTITITVLAASTNDYTSRVAGTIFSTNMQNVYLNGVQDSTRTIAALGSNGAGATNALGEFYGSNNSSQVSWGNDQSGWQTKVLKSTMTDAQTQGATVMHRIDGGVTANNSTGTVYNRFYVMFSLWGDRNIFAYRDPASGDEMKIAQLGTGFNTGEVVLMYRYYGGFSLSVDSDNSQRGSLWSCSDYAGGIGNPHMIPTPHPWGSQTGSGAAYQKSGQWAPNTVGVPPVVADGKLAYYTYYGFIDGSSKGIYADIPALGTTGVDGSGNQTPWLDERAMTVGGTSVTWPMAQAGTNAPTIALNKWNYFQLFFEREADGWGSVAAWHCVPGQQPKPIIIMAPRSIYWGSDSYAQISHRVATMTNYDTPRKAFTGRPTQVHQWGEFTTSLSPIKFPGGILPPYNRG